MLFCEKSKEKCFFELLNVFVFCRVFEGLMSELQDELDTLKAIYGDDVVSSTGSSVSISVSNTSGSRCITLVLVVDASYPNSVPAVDFDVQRGVKRENFQQLRTAIEEEGKQLIGMPMIFSLAEKAKQVMDGLDEGNGKDEAAAEKEKEKEKENTKLNHQVGSPLIVDGTRCTEEVFLAWRERWLERRLQERKELEQKRAEALGNKPTGKELFLRGAIKASDDGLAYSELGSQLTFQEGAVDESLFKNVNVNDIPDE